MSDLASLTIPALFLALLLAIFGVWRQKRWFPVVAAVLISPSAWYMTSNTDFGLLAWLLPISLLGAAFAIHKGIRWLAWVLLLPLLGAFLLFVIAVLAWVNMR